MQTLEVNSQDGSAGQWRDFVESIKKHFKITKDGTILDFLYYLRQWRGLPQLIIFVYWLVS